MDALYHIVLSLLGAMALGFHLKHTKMFVLLACLLSAVMELDRIPNVFFTGALHNLWFVLVLPLALFAFTKLLGKIWRIRALERFFLLIAALSTGHLVLDVFAGPEKVLYPLSDFALTLQPLYTVIPFPLNQFIGPMGLGLVVYGLVLLSARLFEDRLDSKEKVRNNFHQNMELALDELTGFR